MTKTLQELTELIIEWGSEKGIYEKSSYEYQLNKTLEEITELHKAILDDDIEQIKDAIGDIYVTLVMAGQFEKEITKGINKHSEYNWSYSDKSYIENISWIIHELSFVLNIKDNPEIWGEIVGIISSLEGIAERSNLEFLDCIEHAYNIISKRKGKMTNGVFVKDE